MEEEFNAEGGIKLTAEHGPVKIETHGELSRSRESASRSARRTAQEVIEKAAERVRTRVLERRERRLVQEVEEVNRHKFGNEGEAVEANIVGIYQWLEKVYQAQVFNYGHRDMYEAIVPEPAAGLIAAVQNEATVEQPQTVEKPMDIVFARALAGGVSGLDADSVDALVEQYGVTEKIAPYPEPLLRSAVIHHHEPEKETAKARSSGKVQLEIPPHYAPTECWIAARARSDASDKDPKIGETIGDHSEVMTGFAAMERRGPARPRGGVKRKTLFADHAPMSGDEGATLDVGVAADDAVALTVAVTIRLEPQEAAREKWRRDAFNVIRKAYDDRLQKWREAQQVEEFESQGGPETLAKRHPAGLRGLEREELQRLVVEIMRNRDLRFDALMAREGSPLPMIDFDERAERAPEIHFLQQAFEWQNMTYVLYPYFYGRPGTWAEKVLYRGADARFVEFLKAGAARVQLPVRPGFEAAVDHYVRTGRPWEKIGEIEALISDDAGLWVLGEKRERAGADQPATHVEGEDFEVELPTTLVKLRRDEQLPTWHQLDSGRWQEEHPA